jgi:hypothetical protein
LNSYYRLLMISIVFRRLTIYFKVIGISYVPWNQRQVPTFLSYRWGLKLKPLVTIVNFWQNSNFVKIIKFYQNYKFNESKRFQRDSKTDPKRQFCQTLSVLIKFRSFDNLNGMNEIWMIEIANCPRRTSLV